MLLTMNQRQTKATVPHALEFTRTCYGNDTDVLATPPPTAMHHLQQQQQQQMKAPVPGVKSLCMPLTPMTPDTSIHLLQEQQQHVGESDSDTASTSTPNADSNSVFTADSSPHLVIADTDSYLNRKRSLVELVTDTDSVESQPGRKRVLTEADLIPNPLYLLRNVPMAYVKERLPQLVSSYFGKAEGAACYIRAVPLSGESIRDNMMYTTVTPRRDSSRPFVMRAPRDMSKYGKLVQSKAAPSPIMHLHVECSIFRAPLIGHLLLSGHVLKGDMIQIELPDPEVFVDLVYWMYTGNIKQIEKRESILACIQYLTRT